VTEAAWLALAHRACDRIAEALAGHTVADRAPYLGRGAGGDRTAEVDRWAEEIVVDELVAAHAAGSDFTLVSEELGVRDFGRGAAVVVVDPIDGSLNARRGLPLFSTSFAVADGPRMGDVWLGVVRDHGTGEEHVATRGGGARTDGAAMAAGPADGLELVALEMAGPAAVARAASRLHGVNRLRMMGSLALALCAVGAGRLDGLASLAGARSVDVAAGQLIAREAGATVGAPHPQDLDGWPLDVTAHRPIVAAHSADALARLAAAREPEAMSA
jgi:myo-inositol-1(or 4)-monophosphatase